MKKLPALVLALALTLSSASAIEFKDFKDKDEIQYPEAVAVLNRLGIIVGFGDEHFHPDCPLSRASSPRSWFANSWYFIAMPAPPFRVLMLSLYQGGVVICLK